MGMSLNDVYHALADPSRRAMLSRLAERSPLSVSDLAAPLPIQLPTVMKHLGVLDRAGLIRREKVGRTTCVSLRPDPMAEAMAWLEQAQAFWSARLARLADVVEREQS